MSAVRTSLNRTHQAVFLESLARRIAAAAAAPTGFALLLVQLKNFDELNVALGYTAVDDIMFELASRLCTGFDSSARCLRVGTKKFAIVLEGVESGSHALLAARKVERLAHEPAIRVEGKRIKLGLSFGIALYPQHAESEQALLLAAESALGAARLADGLCVYSPDRALELCELHRAEVELIHALESGGIETYFQPQVDALTGAPVGAEALLRCKDSNGIFLPPELVVQAASRAKLLPEMTSAVLHSALRHAAEWPDERCRLSFNVSPHSLEDQDFVASVDSAIRIWGRRPENLSIEITESAFMADPETSFAVMRRLRDMGLRVAIDDFGTGYSSLAYFKNIPANELKVDKSFVFNMSQSDADRRIVKAVIDLAHQFDLEVVAEGVEDEGGLEILREMGCDIVQGFLIGKPMPPAAFAEWLGSMRRAD